MTLVPLGAVSLTARALTIAMAQNPQKISHVMSTNGQQISHKDALVIGKVTGYIAADFLKAHGQVKAFQAVLYSIFGEKHSMTIMYIRAVKFFGNIILSFKKALIKNTEKSIYYAFVQLPLCCRVSFCFRHALS